MARKLQNSQTTLEQDDDGIQIKARRPRGASARVSFFLKYVDEVGIRGSALVYHIANRTRNKRAENKPEVEYDPESEFADMLGVTVKQFTRVLKDCEDAKLLFHDQGRNMVRIGLTRGRAKEVCDLLANADRQDSLTRYYNKDLSARTGYAVFTEKNFSRLSAIANRLLDASSVSQFLLDRLTKSREVLVSYSNTGVAGPLKSKLVADFNRISRESDVYEFARDLTDSLSPITARWMKHDQVGNDRECLNRQIITDLMPELTKSPRLGLNGSVLYSKIACHQFDAEHFSLLRNTVVEHEEYLKYYRASHHTFVGKFPWMTVAVVNTALDRLKHAGIVAWDTDGCDMHRKRYYITKPPGSSKSQNVRPRDGSVGIEELPNEKSEEIEKISQNVRPKTPKSQNPSKTAFLALEKPTKCPSSYKMSVLTSQNVVPDISKCPSPIGTNITVPVKQYLKAKKITNSAVEPPRFVDSFSELEAEESKPECRYEVEDADLIKLVEAAYEHEHATMPLNDVRPRVRQVFIPGRGGTSCRPSAMRGSRLKRFD